MEVEFGNSHDLNGLDELHHHFLWRDTLFRARHHASRASCRPKSMSAKEVFMVRQLETGRCTLLFRFEMFQKTSLFLFLPAISSPEILPAHFPHRLFTSYPGFGDKKAISIWSRLVKTPKNAGHWQRDAAKGRASCEHRCKMGTHLDKIIMTACFFH